MVLIDSHADIEIALDLGEDENKKETKKELDEKKTFFQLHTTLALAKNCHQNLQNNHILHQYRNHIIDVQSPPPKHTV
ncbi:MAG: hypothetical protein ACI9Y7_003141 [Dokdonia sp.]|jgi:hypothetical protein